MRTIKFRGKRCDNSEWVCGYYVECHHTWSRGHLHKSWIITSARSNGGFFALQGRYPVQDQTIGQFTGLFDKNGKEIYEGDILQTRAKFTGVVRWNNKGYFYLNDDKEQKEKSCENLGIMLNYAQFEIIGNYFDNPELLERGEQ